MKGTLTFTGATENYYIANYSWRMPIKFSGDTFIGNEVTGIGFNNNGALNLGGRKNSPEFIATIDSEGIYTGGVVRAIGHTAKAYGQGTFANQWDDKKAPYVVHNPNANGQNIYYPFIKGFNTNGNQYGTAFSFGYMTPGTINQFGSGAIHLLTDSGNGKIWWFGHDGVLRGDDFATNGGRKLSKSIQVNDIVVISGIINNGATIPLPAGFAEHECKFLVSMRSDNPDSTVWDINEDGSHLHYRYECKLEGRKVIARTWIGGHGSTSNRWIGGEANYIVIGIKGA